MSQETISREKLSMLLGVSIVPAVLEAARISEPEEVDRFYRSRLYQLLSDPATGVWHLSARILADAYAEELSDGSFELPEEQS